MLDGWMTGLMGGWATLAAAGGGAAAHAAPGIPAPGAGSPIALLLLGLPLLAAALCGVFAATGNRSKLPAFTSVAALGACFGIALMLFLNWNGQPATARAFDWISLDWGAGKGQSFDAHFGVYIDGLTLLWMLFVTGLATVIALYSMEYMSHDVGLGYCRYFAAFNLFVFSMTALVMGDNLLMLFLGWEGVGLCSYLLIGYYYKRAAAVAAAKKAFIMNRIGDLGLLMGILSTFVVFGTIEYAPLFQMIASGKTASGAELASHWSVWGIPLMFAVGAFGKSAQFIFYTWLPDAMEGPTPVSALIHAATMVTAGVFLIGRLYPLFTADPALIALSVVAWAGVITALWAATIEMAIFDIKRVMGYSTISQLGFMFAGMGLLTPTGAAFHTFTHAFFKATLFLGVGAVMHGFGGQLDLRRLSGVMWMRGFGLVGIAMLVGSINLSGVPFTAGFFSKDVILAQAFTTPGTMIWGAQAAAWLLLLTAGMTAYYTFRTFLRVYVGPREFVPGDDAELLDLGRHPKGVSLDEWHAQHGHGHGHGHGHDDHGHGSDHRAAVRPDFDPTTEEFDPHPPGWSMKAAIGLCMVLSILAAGVYFMKPAVGNHGGWVAGMVGQSSAAFASPGEHHGGAAEHAAKLGTFLGYDPHKVMYYVSAGVGLIGILIAAFLHGPRGVWSLFIGNRTSAAVAPRADALANLFGPLTRAARNKYYVDEIYDALVRTPLRVLAHIFHILDQGLVDGLVNLCGALPRMLARSLRPSQSGVLQGYAVGMAAGLGLILIVVWVLMLR
ncbi:MAG: NADH-quinone oxidoreductase subunit L [Phycisphaerales bacterium]|nr:NADH-quinone oxidoreductase subunit L [Phycisphaerales bacterium]